MSSRDINWSYPIQAFDGRKVELVQTLMTKSGIDPFDAPHSIIRYFNNNGQDTVNIVRSKTGFCGYAKSGAPHPDTIINVPDRKFPPGKGVSLYGWSPVYQNGDKVHVGSMYETKGAAQNALGYYGEPVAVIKVLYEFDIGEGL